MQTTPDAVQRAEREAAEARRKAEEQARRARLKALRDRQRAQDALECVERLSRRLGVQQGSAEAVSISAWMQSGRGKHVQLLRVEDPRWEPPTGYEPIYHKPGSQYLLHDGARHPRPPKGTKAVDNLAGIFGEFHERKCMARNRMLESRGVSEYHLPAREVAVHVPEVASSFDRLDPELQRERQLDALQRFVERHVKDPKERRQVMRAAASGDPERMARVGLVARPVQSPDVDERGQGGEELDVYVHKWSAENPYPAFREGDPATRGVRVVTLKQALKRAERWAALRYNAADGPEADALAGPDPLDGHQAEAQGSRHSRTEEDLVRATEFLKTPRVGEIVDGRQLDRVEALAEGGMPFSEAMRQAAQEAASGKLAEATGSGSAEAG